LDERNTVAGPNAECGWSSALNTGSTQVVPRITPAIDFHALRKPQKGRVRSVVAAFFF